MKKIIILIIIVLLSFMALADEEYGVVREKKIAKIKHNETGFILWTFFNVDDVADTTLLGIYYELYNEAERLDMLDKMIKCNCVGKSVRAKIKE